MRPVITVTLNPALDMSVTAPHVEPGPKLRCSAPQIDPGGGGINVARVVAEMQGICRAVVAVGGTTGQELLARLEARKVPVVAFDVNGATRQSLSVVDQETGQQYRFIMPGPDWDSVTVERALGTIISAAPDNALVVLSGSLPPGVSPEFPARLVAALPGREVVMDLSGAALLRVAAGTDHPPKVLRMDREESEGLPGSPLPDATEAARFGRRLIGLGAAEIVILARGPDGSVLVTATEAWHCSAAKVEVASKTGAGDSFVGAFAFALSDGRSLPDALQLGVAAASAAVTTPATDLCHRAKVMELLPRCHVTRLEV